MHLLIGTDEAGYGPNLGPLIVAASAWQAPKKIAPEKLYDHLAKFVATECAADDEPRLAIADSKALYSPGSGLAEIECGVLSCLALPGLQPTSTLALWNALAANCHGERTALAWHAAEEEQLPIDACAQRIGRCVEALAAGFKSQRVEFKALRATAVFPGTFNAEVERHENKATVLSLVTLELIKTLLDELPELPAKITCDKHGGRDRYAHLIQHVFGDDPVRVVQESKAISIYRLTYAGRTVELQFLAKGERMLAAALASMTAKYLREISLRPFNRFWQEHVPGLKATAGYPNDARRFKAEIQVAQQRLGIDDRVLWRCR
jgi:ribonuclease HII